MATTDKYNVILSCLAALIVIQPVSVQGRIIVQLMSEPSNGTVWYEAGHANFGYDLSTSSPVSGRLYKANPFSACPEDGIKDSNMEGKIVLVERGPCGFSDKAYVIQDNGAIGGIVIDTRYPGLSIETYYLSMGPSEATAPHVSIPLVVLRDIEGSQLLEAFSNDNSLVVKLSAVPPRSLHTLTVQLFPEPCNHTLSLLAVKSSSEYNLQTMDPVRGFVVIADAYEACPDTINNTDKINGKIVILQRGTCNFAEKAQVIQSGGAIGGIVIDNNVGSTVDENKFYMVVGSDISIPMVFMFGKEGLQLLDIYNRENSMEVVMTDGSYSTNCRYVLLQLTSSPYYGSEWYQACLLSSIEPSTPFESVHGDLRIASDSRACSSFLNYGDLKGNIVIVQAGDCSFDEKVTHLNNTGAIAGIVLDNVTGTEINTKFARVITRPTGIPLVYLRGNDARSLLMAYNKQPDLQIAVVRSLLNISTTTKEASMTTTDESSTEAETTDSSLGTTTDSASTTMAIGSSAETKTTVSTPGTTAEQTTSGTETSDSFTGTFTETISTTVKYSTPKKTTEPPTDITGGTMEYSIDGMTTHQSRDWTNQTLQTMIVGMAIDKKSTNKNYRRYHTIEDTRPTSTVIGIGLILPIVVVYISILLVDIPKLIAHFLRKP